MWSCLLALWVFYQKKPNCVLVSKFSIISASFWVPVHCSHYLWERDRLEYFLWMEALWSWIGFGICWFGVTFVLYLVLFIHIECSTKEICRISKLNFTGLEIKTLLTGFFVEPIYESIKGSSTILPYSKTIIYKYFQKFQFLSGHYLKFLE